MFFDYAFRCCMCMTETEHENTVEDYLDEIDSLANNCTGHADTGKEIKQTVKKIKMELNIPVSVTIVCNSCQSFGRYEVTSPCVDCAFCDTENTVTELISPHAHFSE